MGSFEKMDRYGHLLLNWMIMLSILFQGLVLKMKVYYY